MWLSVFIKDVMDLVFLGRDAILVTRFGVKMGTAQALIIRSKQVGPMEQYAKAAEREK